MFFYSPSDSKRKWENNNALKTNRFVTNNTYRFLYLRKCVQKAIKIVHKLDFLYTYTPSDIAALT